MLRNKAYTNLFENDHRDVGKGVWMIQEQFVESSFSHSSVLEIWFWTQLPLKHRQVQVGGPCQGLWMSSTELIGETRLSITRMTEEKRMRLHPDRILVLTANSQQNCCGIFFVVSWGPWDLCMSARSCVLRGKFWSFVHRSFGPRSVSCILVIAGSLSFYRYTFAGRWVVCML